MGALAPKGSGRRPRARVSGVRSTVVLLALLVGCAGSGGSSGSRYMTLRTGQGAHQLALASDGQIIGPSMQLSPTSTGYRGMADSAMVDLRSDGEHILGTIHDQVVDLHVSVGDDGL